ncbi:hypothetical protein GCM10027275_25040 [Rhabdobacter roseus]|uniref:DUF3850 domain-containing protein n=1 Tax=Rhabdobacter roseus TaxID=1655419 RepID=A0A840TM17_9BACT|nr:DUF3850 domain-containing protein [Rhabdobacter roseus]MBB5284444.1 hypothetical protein [Rhabdobacter roseus]
MKTHILKVDKDLFPDLETGVKNFEVRLNDRDFKVHDYLILKEHCRETGKFTGNIARRIVRYILPGGQYGIEPGYVVLGLQ